MCRKLYFVVAAVLVLALTGSARAGTPIADREFNFSWEWDPNGEPMPCHTGDMDDSLAWEDNGKDWSGVDVNCGHEATDCDNCKDWFITPDGNVVLFVNGGSATFQLLDPAIDANVIIEAGKKYTMLIDLMTYDDWYFDISFYHSTDPCWIPETDVNVIVLERFLLTNIFHPVLTERNDWFYDCKVSFVATPDADYIGDRLGIHLNNPYAGGTWLFADNVRLEWEWATNAYNPSPADGEGYVLQDKDPSWTPGLWADEHIVYIGTDWEDVNNRSRTGGTSDYVGEANSFDPGTLQLGATYYWTVTEVNEGFTPIPGVPNPPWIGDIWSFRVEGNASNPSPEDNASDIPFVGTILSWTPGTDSNSHNVYLGTDKDDVTNATTSVTLGVFKENRDANYYDPGFLMTGQDYYWRIDEVNETAGTLITGTVWKFTAVNYLVVDDFDSYVTTNDLLDVWNDYYVNGTGAGIFIIKDVNFTEDGNAMEFQYENEDPYYKNYSEAYADITDLEITSDWTAGGIKVLTLSFMGDKDNALDDMYVALTDGSNRTGKVLYPDVNELAIGWTGFRQWNIELDEFVDDNSVNLTDIHRLTIGFGDKSTGGTGTVYFDNIRLYPPRCVLSKALEQGSFDYDGDCIVDYYDLDVLADRDWLLTAIGNVTATVPNNAPTSLVGHWPMDDDDLQRQVDDISGNAHHGLLYDPDKHPGNKTSSHSIDDGAIGKALTFDGFDDYVEILPLNLNTNEMTISAWVRRTGSPNIYAGIVFTSDPCSDPNTTAGIMLGADTVTWEANNELAYMWTGDAWEWHTGLYVPDYWSFVAMTIAPDMATLYLDDGLGLKAARNYVAHEVKPWSGLVRIGDQMQYEERIFKGAIDDVRIYNYTLTPEEILYLALQGAGSAYIELPTWRADPTNDDEVNFKDFAVMADNWLQEVLWP